MENKTETAKAVETVQVAKDSIESLAANISKIATAANSILSAGLKEETLVLLLHDHSKVSKRDIKQVLRSLGSLGYYRGK